MILLITQHRKDNHLSAGGSGVLVRRSISRRQFLCSTGVGTTATAWGAVQRRAGKIDVHHHIEPQASSSVGGRGSGGGPWSPEIAIEEMDRNGVAAGIGFPGPIPFSNDLVAGRRLSRQYNEFGAKLAADHPGRFGLFAALPFHDTDGIFGWATKPSAPSTKN